MLRHAIPFQLVKRGLTASILLTPCFCINTASIYEMSQQINIQILINTKILIRLDGSFPCCRWSSDLFLSVLEWVWTRESSSESESTRPESESESESIRPESESIRCESESIEPESESESESIGPESESSGSESESESLSPDSAWTHESNNRKVLYFNPTLTIFAELFIDNW